MQAASSSLSSVSAFDRAVALIYECLGAPEGVTELLSLLQSVPSELDARLEPHLARAVQIAVTKAARPTRRDCALAIYSAVGTCVWSQQGPGGIQPPGTMGGALARRAGLIAPTGAGRALIHNMQVWPNGLDDLPATGRLHYGEGCRLVSLTPVPERGELLALARNHLDLTPRQAELVVQLAMDGSLKSACDSLLIGYETGRGHLRDAFRRTGIRSQVELVHLIWWLALLPPTDLGSSSLPATVRARIKHATGPDGAMLSYSEGGVAYGRPVILFHQCTHAIPISDRLHAAAVARGMRLICPDRIGFGLSDFGSRRSGSGRASTVDEVVAESVGHVEACLQAVIDGPMHLMATGAGCAFLAAFAAQTHLPIASVHLVIPRRSDAVNYLVGSPIALSLHDLLERRPRIGRQWLSLLRWLDHRPSLKSLIMGGYVNSRIDRHVMNDASILADHLDALGWTLNGKGTGPVREGKIGASGWRLPDLPEGTKPHIVLTDEDIVPHDPEIAAWALRHKGRIEHAKDLGYCCYLAEPERVLGFITP